MYGKHFQSTYSGSMIGLGPLPFAVWGYVIANTVSGYVELNPILLSAIFGKTTPQEIEDSIQLLCAPDPKSRNKEHEGRRLIREGEFSYFVPTHSYYVNIRNESDRRDYMREYMRKRRQDQPLTVNGKQCKHQAANSKQRKPPLANIDTYTNTNTNAEENIKEKAEAKLDQDQQQDQDPCEELKTLLAAKGPAKRKKENEPSKTAATWAMYSETYRQRYGVDPVRNAKINGQLSQFVARVGEGEAPGVAQFYLYHNDSYYIKKGHSVDCLLRDAESLRTQWATRTQITGIGAKQMERTSHNQNVANQVIRELAEKRKPYYQTTSEDKK